MKPLILASASPRRKDLLRQAGVPFVVHPANVDEDLGRLEGTPTDKAEKLAFMKAECAAESCEPGLILGADTIVVLDDEIFGKPADEEEARNMLSKLSGREHLVITGIALVDSVNGISRLEHETTKVRFTVLSSDEIDAYVGTGEPLGKAGAYAVQGYGALLVEGIEGCYSNVVGLPLMRLRKMLEGFGARLL